MKGGRTLTVFGYLAEYKTFNDVEEMNTHVIQHIESNFLSLTKSEIKILLKLSQHSLRFTGACHLKADTIATDLNISTKTVWRAMKKLSSLGIVEVITSVKMNGIKGANIYKILPCPIMSEREKSQREINEKLTESKVETKKSNALSFSSFNLLKTSNTNNINTSAPAVVNEGKEESNKIEHDPKEFMNEYQGMLYDFLNDLPVQEEIKGEMYKAVLASNVNDIKDFIKAKNVLFSVLKDIENGEMVVTKSLRAAFVGAYSKALERSKNRVVIESIMKEIPHKSDKVEFYDWLRERPKDWKPSNESKAKPTLENWLEW